MKKIEGQEKINIGYFMIFISIISFFMEPVKYSVLVAILIIVLSVILILGGAGEKLIEEKNKDINWDDDFNSMIPFFKFFIPISNIILKILIVFISLVIIIAIFILIVAFGLPALPLPPFLR